MASTVHQQTAIESISTSGMEPAVDPGIETDTPTNDDSLTPTQTIQPYHQTDDNTNIMTIKDDPQLITDSNIENNHTAPAPIANLLTIKPSLIQFEDVLDNKMAALDLHESEPIPITKTNSADGSDSGVEIFSAVILNGSGALHRALSNNSGGYASSCGGLDEPIGNVSCDSSMISFCSDHCEVKAPILGRNSNNDLTSEGGSESSSVTGGPISIRRSSTIKKKVNVTEPTSITKSPKKTDALSMVARTRARTASANRALAQAVKSSVAPNLATRERARSREKVPSTPEKQNTQNRSTPSKKSSKPEALPTGRNSTSPAMQKIGHSARTPSASRVRTPGCTPTTDDGRWPSISGRALTNRPQKGGSATPDGLVANKRIGALTMESKSMSVDKFATLPRRRKEKSADDLKKNTRSSSATRDRMSMSLIKRQPSKEGNTPIKPMTLKLKKATPKTKIYHETSVQTAVTGQDVADAFAGVAKDIRVDAIETAHREVQVDIRDKEIEKLMHTINQLKEDKEKLQSTLNEKSQILVTCETQIKREREEKLAAQKELQENTVRVMGLLELVGTTSTTLSNASEENCDSLLILESQIQMSGHALEEKQEEIEKLRSICRSLHVEMERSMAQQNYLAREKDEMEKESTELQDFLQIEKTTLMDALKDTENEVKSYQEQMAQKEHSIERLQEECRHLVRITEQRRQEYLGMVSKYSALESRSKELIIQQSSAVSGASMALAGLGTRLDSLVEQLIASYSISEQELEDVIYHNEAYTNSSGEGSPEYETAGQSMTTSTVALKYENDGSLSPQRHQSFITAVINAIKSAATTAKHSVAHNQKRECVQQQTINEEDSDSTEMLDSETEPCLMMENVLEDVTMPDTHSHNMVSSTNVILSQTDIPSEMDLTVDASLQSLSQAIANRELIEKETSKLMRFHSEHSTSDDMSTHESLAEIPSIGDYCSAQALVDQVIDVDNLVTKLLKVLRIIQIDSDNCIQQLIAEKNKLQLGKEEMLEKIREHEEDNVKFRDELKIASQQLSAKGNDLENSKSELLRHREEIDRLNEDICQLSTLCCQSKTTGISKDDLLQKLKLWKEQGILPEPELVAQIIKACQEIPVLKEQLIAKEHHLNDMKNNAKPLVVANWKDAIMEAKRQYEAIDRALETLHNIQAIVEKCPALSELQRDLEETNFQSAAIIPRYTALLDTANGQGDHNANAALGGSMQLNGTENGVPNQTIDSTA